MPTSGVFSAGLSIKAAGQKDRVHARSFCGRGYCITDLSAISKHQVTRRFSLTSPLCISIRRLLIPPVSRFSP